MSLDAGLLLLAAGGGAYLLGSVSFAYLLVRVTKGIDLRTVGSGNLGATNAGRVLGRRWGFAVYLLDMLKGLLPVLLLQALGEEATASPNMLPPSLVAGLAAYAGHCWPLFHGFRGGKGVATASGAVLGLAPEAALIALGAFVVAFLMTRMVSVGSMVAGLVLPVAYVCLERREALQVGRKLATLTFLLLLGILVVVRHRANIHRIVEGTEPRVGRRRP